MFYFVKEIFSEESKIPSYSGSVSDKIDLVLRTRFIMDLTLGTIIALNITALGLIILGAAKLYAKIKESHRKKQ